jgi:trehalose 6-phosphate synthase
MNLVAKEFVVAQHATDATGVLVLSEFTGAAEQLHEALACNPFDVEGLASTIERALELDEDERRQRLAHMATADGTSRANAHVRDQPRHRSASPPEHGQAPLGDAVEGRDHAAASL